MRLGKIRLTIILIVFIATIIILFGGKNIYFMYKIEQPIQKTFKSMPDIKNVKLENQNGNMNLLIEINKTNNLQKSFQDINNQAKKVFGLKPFKIEINDKSDTVLNETFYFVQFDIYEALEKGDYSNMISKIDNKSKKAGVVTKLFIDDDYLYLQMEHNERYLYKVFSRHKFSQTLEQGQEAKGGIIQNG